MKGIDWGLLPLTEAKVFPLVPADTESDLAPDRRDLAQDAGPRRKEKKRY